MNPSTREAIEQMAQTWVAVGILKSKGHCKKSAGVIYRIVGFDLVDGKRKVTRIMPRLKTLDPYPEQYPRYECLSKSLSLHKDEDFMEQLARLGIMTDGDHITH